MTLAIKVEDVIKTFGKVMALNRVSFSLPKGCILGYLGPNGAGKTTTIRILTKLLEPDSGYNILNYLDTILMTISNL